MSCVHDRFKIPDCADRLDELGEVRGGWMHATELDISSFWGCSLIAELRSRSQTYDH